MVTLDVRFNYERYWRLAVDHFFDGLPPDEPVWTAEDYATDADNEWDDPTVVEAQAFTGWFYDYFSARHRWEGIDGANGRSISMVNVDFANAGLCRAPHSWGNSTGDWSSGWSSRHTASAVGPTRPAAPACGDDKSAWAVCAGNRKFLVSSRKKHFVAPPARSRFTSHVL